MRSAFPFHRKKICFLKNHPGSHLNIKPIRKMRSCSLAGGWISQDTTVKLAWAVTIHKSQELWPLIMPYRCGKIICCADRFMWFWAVYGRSTGWFWSPGSIRRVWGRIQRWSITWTPVKAEELDRVLIEAQEKFILQLVLDHFSLAKNCRRSGTYCLPIRRWLKRAILRVRNPCNW